MAAGAQAWLGWSATSQPRIGIVLGALGLILTIMAQRFGAFRPSRSVAILIGLVALEVVVVCHYLLWPLVQRQPRVGLVSSLAAWLLGLVGVDSSSGRGELRLLSHEGWLAFSPTLEKLALVPSAAFLACALYLWALTSRRVGDLIRLTLWFGVVLLLRYAFTVCRFISHDSILGDGPWKTELFSRPLETFGWLLLAGVPGAWAFRPPNDESRQPHRKGRWFRLVALAYIAGAIFAFFRTWKEPGILKQGRVLIDDSLSGVWEQSARRLDEAWYGDMSMYSFSAATEFLGRYFDVDVNAEGDLTSELLAGYDVLVIKTPRSPLNDQAVEAVLEWVRAGGGLFLIGDHTNLMGMSVHLNRLAEPAGMRFRFDSVMDGATQGFSRYKRPFLGADPAVRDVDILEFMTSCSIEIGVRASPIITVPNSVSQGLDYANNSFFGNWGSDPSTHHAPLVLAATATLDSGRVALFSDSTVFSSFALFLYNRESFLLRTVDFLNRKNGGMGAVSTGGLLVVLALIWRVIALYNSARPGTALLGIALSIPLGILSGTWLANSSNAVAYPGPVSDAEVPRVCVSFHRGEGALPPSLGNLGPFDLDWCYDTMYAAILRCGLFPLVRSSIVPMESDKSFLVVNPSQGPDTLELERMVEWVEAGGRLLIIARSDHLHVHVLESWLRRFGLHSHLPLEAAATGGEAADVADSLHNVRIAGATMLPLPSPSMRLFHARAGRGSVGLLLGSEWLSRERLGHVFDLPDSAQRAYYACWFAALRTVIWPDPVERRTYAILEGAEG